MILNTQSYIYVIGWVGLSWDWISARGSFMSTWRCYIKERCWHTLVTLTYKAGHLGLAHPNPQLITPTWYICKCILFTLFFTRVCCPLADAMEAGPPESPWHASFPWRRKNTFHSFFEKSPRLDASMLRCHRLSFLFQWGPKVNEETWGKGAKMDRVNFFVPF